MKLKLKHSDMSRSRGYWDQSSTSLSFREGLNLNIVYMSKLRGLLKQILLLIMFIELFQVASSIQENGTANGVESTLKLPNGTIAQISSLDEFINVKNSHHSDHNERQKQKERQQQHQHQHNHQLNHNSNNNHVSNATIHSSPNHNLNHHDDKIRNHLEVRGLLNVSHDFPIENSKLIFGYIWPLVALITLFSNLMIVFVLTQRDMITATNVVLTSIAIADIIPIVVPVPWLVYLFTLGYETTPLYPLIACYLYQHMTRLVSEVFYFVSTWLNVLLAVQDYLTACRPDLAQKYCKIRAVIWQICLLTALAIIINLPQALKLKFTSVHFYYNDQPTWGCARRQAKWFKDLVGASYVALYDDLFSLFIVLFVDGGPAIALISLTALLIRQLKRQRIRGHFLMEQARTASKRRREQRRQQEVESSARVLIFVLLAFLAVKIPFATTFSLIIAQSQFGFQFTEDLQDYQKFLTYIDLAFVLSYPINFTIFCCCSKKFRHKCVELLGPCLRARKKDAKELRARWQRGASAIGSRFSLESTMDDSMGGVNSFSEKFPTVPEEIQVENLVTKASEALEESQNQSELPPKIVQPRPSPLRVKTDRLDASKLSNSQLSELDFQTLMESGTICYECVMRYERLKQHYRSRMSSPRQSEMPAIVVQEVTDEDSETIEVSQGFKMSPRSDINSEASWPVPPPPPPPLSAAMTAFEFSWPINPSYDHSSRESFAHSEKIGQEKEDMLRQMGRTLNEPRDFHYIIDQGEQQLPSPPINSNLTPKGSDPESIESDLSSKVPKRSSDETVKSLRNPEDNSPNNNNSTDRHSSMPPGNSWGSQDGSRRKLLTCGPHINRRSISLSDSKLSTLPNATGFLANVMITTLVGQKAQTERDESKGKLSKHRKHKW